MDSAKTVYLVDASAYMYRSYHAVRNLTASDGFPTNAIFGFTRMITKLLKTFNPIYGALLFDAKGPTFRHEEYKEYKATRPPLPEDFAVQIPIIKDMSRALAIPSIELGGYEADDLIATLARRMAGLGCNVVVVTSDKDCLQLITPVIKLWDPVKEVWRDEAYLAAEFGITAGQIVEMMALSGDTSDNVPGVRGIGPKGALELIKAYGNLENLYNHLEEIKRPKQRESLQANKDNAFLSRDLVRLNDQAPLETFLDDLKLQTPDYAVLADYYRRFEFRDLLRDSQSHLQQDAGALFSQAGAASTSTPPPVKTEEAAADAYEFDPHGPFDYQAVLDMDKLDLVINQLKAAGYFAVDTETTSTNAAAADLVGISLATVPNQAFYIPLKHSYLGAPAQLPLKDVLDKLRPVFTDAKIKKCGQNIKYDMIVLQNAGLEIKGVAFDTMIAAYLINPSQRSFGLDNLALSLFGHEMIAYADVCGKGKSQICFDMAEVARATEYAAEDADFTLKTHLVLAPKLKQQGLKKLFDEVEMPLVPILAQMEAFGIKVDIKVLRGLSDYFAGRLAEIEQKIYDMAGEEFNINSTQQLGRILFEKLGLDTQKKTKKKTGYSTDVEVLSSLAEIHELPALVLEQRTLGKLKSTYADALVNLVNHKTGRIHASFNQTGAATGRFSSSNPNLQNIPIRDEEGLKIREAFVADAGHVLLSADYSQIELRLLAHYSGDKALIESFEKDEDVHLRTASEIFGIPPEAVSPELRRQAKAINFGLIYGKTPFGLAKELQISQKMAKTYIDNYFAHYKGVQKFIAETIASVQETGKTETLLGRVRYLPDINSANRNVRQAAERVAVNTPLQGTAADLIKLAMINMDKALSENGLKSKMLLTVHDELVFEVPDNEIETMTTLCHNVMENVMWLKVKLKVNVAYGANWAQAH